MLVAVTPCKLDVPPTYKFLPIPTPPITCSAPVIVDVASVLLVMVVIPEILVAPTTSNLTVGSTPMPTLPLKKLSAVPLA